ncbi:U2 snRNA binding protein [Aureococcus anophagefferens]|nr:U2 snRNA binding protein [Aureococcus anophagefferens]
MGAEEKDGEGPPSPAKVVVSRTSRHPFVMNLSFLEISHLRDLPAKLNIVAPPKEREEKGEGGEKHAHEKHAPRKRRLKCCSVRLSNNHITSVEGVEGDEGSRLSTALADVCADINALRWIDVSFNQISRIGDAFAHFPHVTVLYLHANNIASLSQVKALGELKELRSLTLHGNPIEDKKHDRTFVIHTIPTLTQLDFSTITRQDRETAAAWALTFRNKLAGRPSNEDDVGAF